EAARSDTRFIDTRGTRETPISETRGTLGSATPILQERYGVESEMWVVRGTEHVSTVSIGFDDSAVGGADTVVPIADQAQPTSLVQWNRAEAPNPFHYSVTTSADRNTLEWWVTRDALYPVLAERLTEVEVHDPMLIADTLRALRDLADHGIPAENWSAAVN